MSVSLKSTKPIMYAEIERLRTECARLESLLIPVVTQPVVVRDKSVFIAAANKQRAEFAVARTEFVVSWCAANAQTSCPSNVVAEWASARR